MPADELAVAILQNVVTNDLVAADDPTVWAPVERLAVPRV
jgi:hypothetical protein